MDSNPIKYSDLIKDDGAIDKAIKDLEALEQSYSEAVNAVKEGAKGMSDEIKKTSVATGDGRKNTEKLSYEARRLRDAYRELKLAMSETGRTIQDLKVQTSELNMSSRDQAKLNRSIEGSYTNLKAQLKLLVTEYKNVISAQGLNSEASKKLLNQIIATKTELKKHDDAMRVHITRLKEQKAQLTAEEKARERLKAAMSSQSVELAKLNKQTQEATRIAKLKAVIDTEQEGSYNRLSAQYALNKIELNKMSQAERETTESGRKLVQETYDIYQAMIKLQEATGKHTLSVGNYKKSWDGLGVAINQVMREVPAAAISINTFFLGISNNIPILIDEIQRLRMQNKMFAADGKPTVSITKQIVSSIFSWNTALIAVLTILAMHGDAIIKWAKELITGKVAVLSLNEAIEAINESLEKGTGNYGQNLVKYKQLKKEWEDLKGLKEREKWVLNNADAFRQLDIAVNNVNDADRVFVNNTDEILTAFKDRAKAAAAEELAIKKYQEAFAKREEAKLEEKKGPSGLDILVGSVKEAYGLTQDKYSVKGAFEDRVSGLYAEADAAEADAESFYKLAEGYKAAADAVLGTASKKSGRKGKQPLDISSFLDRTSTDVQKKYMESLTKYEKDEFAKRRKEALETYSSEVSALNDKYNKVTEILNNENNKYKDLTEEQRDQALKIQDTIIKAIEQKQKQLTQDLTDIENERQINELQILQETIDLRLQAVKKGSEDELKLRLQSVDTQRRIALLQNRLKPADQRQSETDINASFGKTTTTTVSSYNIESFDQQQALAEAEFNIVKQNEYRKTRFKLQQERDRWIKLIQLAESGAIDMSETEIKTMKATVLGIDNELSRLDYETPFLERLGFSDDQIGAFETIKDEIISSLQEIVDAEVELAEKAVEAAQERADAAKEAYDAEIEARNNGYANNVATAKKEYEQEKKKLQQKEQLLAQAQRRQQALDSLEQTSSLITASANIWKSMSGLGPFGIAAAIAGIATMWTSFAAAKVKARQITSQVEEYGDGGFEILEGGSHASGNDIDLGVQNKRHKRMKAEGGEALAIINKRQTRKYKNILPNIINSLNKGTFEDTYASKIGDDNSLVQAIQYNSPVPDLSKLENTVEEIRKQGETKYQVGPNGSVIEVSKNVKRIIK